MRGKLSDTPFADTARRLSNDEVTGALEVTGAPGVARVFFRAGDVYWAMSPAPRARLGDRLVNAGFITQDQLDHALEQQRRAEERTKLGALLVDQELVGHDVIRVFVQEQILDALFDLVQWADGDWVFHAGDAVDDKLPIDVPVSQLLVEASRRQSEWDQIRRTIPTLDTIPDHVVGGNATTAALEQDEFTMLASIDGARSVRELASDLGYSEFEAGRIVYGLTLLGIVEILPEDAGDDEEEAEPDPPPADVAASPPSATTGGPDLGASAPADDDIDVGEALEHALFGGPGSEPDEGDDLEVTVHFALDGQEDDSGEPVGPSTKRPASEDAPAPEPASFSTDDPTPSPASFDTDEPAAVSTDEPVPEPPTFDTDGPAPEPGTADAPEPPAPPEVAGAGPSATVSSAFGPGEYSEEDEPEPWVFSTDDSEMPDEAPAAPTEPPPPAREAMTPEPAAREPDAPRPRATDPEPTGPAEPAVDEIADDLAALDGLFAEDEGPDEAMPAEALGAASDARAGDDSARAASDARAGDHSAGAPDHEGGASLTDLSALVADLANGDDEGTDGAEAAPEPGPETAESPRSASPPDTGADEREAPAAPAGSSAPGAPPPGGDEAAEQPATSRPRGADVSELMRELTQLNLEDEDEDADDSPEPPRRGSSKQDQDDEDDEKKKKKGLFGWGR